jgi:hypothetical protein
MRRSTDRSMAPTSATPPVASRAAAAPAASSTPAARIRCSACITDWSESSTERRCSAAVLFAAPMQIDAAVAATSTWAPARHTAAVRSNWRAQTARQPTQACVEGARVHDGRALLRWVSAVASARIALNSGGDRAAAAASVAAESGVRHSGPRRHCSTAEAAASIAQSPGAASEAARRKASSASQEAAASDGSAAEAGRARGASSSAASVSR